MRSDARKNYEQLLEVARGVFAKQGVDASLRDVARKAGVGMGTLYRHFPTREVLLETLLRSDFDALAARARELETSGASDEALVSWLHEIIAFTYENRGVIALMMGAIEDLDSALHASCVTLRGAGAALLTRAQAEGTARTDLDGAELFDLIAALAWLREQPSHAPRADRIFELIASAVLRKEDGGKRSSRRGRQSARP